VIVGASPAFAVTRGRAEPDADELDADNPESETVESDIELTPNKIAPSMIKTRTAASTARNEFFICASLPFSFSLRCIRLAVVKRLIEMQGF
jgi:hypothetical protein